MPVSSPLSDRPASGPQVPDRLDRLIRDRKVVAGVQARHPRIRFAAATAACVAVVAALQSIGMTASWLGYRSLRRTLQSEIATGILFTGELLVSLSIAAIISYSSYTLLNRYLLRRQVSHDLDGNVCLYCGYDLKGLAQTPTHQPCCPECGKRAPPDDR